MRRDQAPLQVGEVVQHADGCGELTGVVLERLSDDYVRVKWSNFSSPSAHRGGSLRRAIHLPSLALTANWAWAQFPDTAN